MHGILVCNKPPGKTSRDIVNIVARQVRPAKVGHAGTLDPLAEGVLLLTVGAATRLVPYLHLFPKTYTATFQLGISSPSGDLELPTEQQPEAPVPSNAELVLAANRLTGCITQVPPQHSAIKVAGKRAYRAARNDEVITMPPREVTVHRFDVDQYAYPFVRATIECGSGTYIRSLGIDLAAQLGTVAVMTHLRRESIGPYNLAQAVPLCKLTDLFDTLPLLAAASECEADDGGTSRTASNVLVREAPWENCLQPLATATGALPGIILSDQQVIEIRHGRCIPNSSKFDAQNGEIAGYDTAGKLVAILVVRQQGLGPKRVFQFAI